MPVNVYVYTLARNKLQEMHTYPFLIKTMFLFI